MEPDIYVRRWASACHWSTLMGFIFFPLGPPLVAFVVWRLKRKGHCYIDEQGRESVNFQLSMTLYGFIAGVLLWVLHSIFLGYFLGWVPILIYIAQMFFAFVGASRSYDGERFRYPFTIQFVAPLDI